MGKFIAAVIILFVFAANAKGNGEKAGLGRLGTVILGMIILLGLLTLIGG